MANQKVKPSKDQLRINNLEADIKVLQRRYDKKSNLLEWAFRHPIRFAIGRIYHQNIKRDQKNAK